MCNYSFILLSILLFAASGTMATTFSDNFEDNDISDWEARANPGNWSVSGGMVHGNTGHPASLLIASDGFLMENGEVTISAGGVHAFGIHVRLDENDSGVSAYVSPDHDVARIRLVTNGTLSTILSSLNADFPSDVMYLLTLTCEGELLTFHIESPFTGDSWEFSAIDPNPQPGMFGFHMGDEYGAYWDWITATGTVSVEESSSGIVPQPYLSVLANPFTDSVTFRYCLPDGGGSSIDVYDLSGRMVQSIPVNAGAAGEDIVWNSTEPSGVFFARLAGTGLMPVRLIKL